MYVIMKKELKSYFTSFFAYLYFAIFFLVTGIFFVVNCLTSYSTQFGYYVLSNSFLVTIAVIPLCTMRLFAQERRNKTDQMLFTAPVSTFSILMGKYLATAIYVLLPVIVCGIYPIIIASYGEMSVRFLMGSYLGGCLVVLGLLSVGMFLSSLTTNIVLAAVMNYAVYTVILLGRMIEGIVSDNEALYQFFHNISIYNKYNDMGSGIVRSGDVIYLLLVIVCFFLLTWISLESRRLGKRVITIYTTALIISVIAISFVAFANTKAADFTAERLLTLSDETKQTVSEIENPTDIYYMGVRSRANATYQELLNAYKGLSDNITVHYKNVQNDSAFREKYLYNVNYVEEASILVVCGEKYIYLDAGDYITTTQTSAYSSESMLEIEEQLTRAILYTNTEDADKICITSGHGEESLNSGFTSLLSLNNYELDEVNLATAVRSIKKVFPEDCKAVLVNAPQSDFTEEELDILREYIQSGGELFVTLDPLNEDLDKVYAFLKEYGLEVQSGVVMEQEEGRYAYNTQYYLVPKIETTRYTEEILGENLTVLTLTSKGIRKNGTANGYTCTDILTTSSTSYSKVSDFENLTNKTDEDIAGPFSVASCAGNPEEGDLFLITSNVFFNEDADAESQGGNRRFFIEILRQLTGTEAGVWIDGKNVGSQKALYPSSMQKQSRIVMIVVIPVCIILFGILVLVLRYKDISFYAIGKRKKDVEEA